MRSSNFQQQIFIAALFFAWMAIFVHVVIYRRLQASGFEVKWIGYPQDMVAAYRVYYREAIIRGWSRVPLYIAVLSEGMVILLGIAFFTAGAYLAT